MCLELQGDGVHWLCYSVDEELVRFWSAVRLAEGAVVPATSTGADRQYPGLADEEVNWMCGWEDNCQQVYSPTPEEAKEVLEEGLSLMGVLGSLSEQAYCVAGVATRLEPLWRQAGITQLGITQLQDGVRPGRFLAVLRGGRFQEVMLCAQLSGDGRWLCRTTNCHHFIWAAVQLAGGAFLLAQGEGDERQYPGTSADEVDWSCAHDGSLWKPEASERQQLVAEAQQLLPELSRLPPQAFALAGRPGALPSVQEAAMQRVEPGIGRFALVLWNSTWREVLLCGQLGSAQHWLCLACTPPAPDAAEEVAFFWTVVYLTEGHYCVMHAPPDGNKLWLPVPKRVRKALSDAAEVMQTLGAVPAEAFVVAGQGPSESVPRALLAKGLPDIFEIAQLLRAS